MSHVKTFRWLSSSACMYCLLLFAGLSSCKSSVIQNTLPSNIEIHDSDKEPNITIIKTEKLPFIVPGKWTQFHFDPSSKQYFYRNADSVILALAIHHEIHLPFFSRKFSSWELVKRYYNWDANHQTKAGNYPELIRENKEDNYLLWKFEENGIRNVFLLGAKSVFMFNLLVFTDRWNQDEQEAFLKKAYSINIIAN